MKRIMSLLAVSALAVSLSACAPQQTAEIAMITDIGTIDDKSFNQGTWEGIELYSKDTGRASRYYRPAGEDYAAYTATIDLAVQGGAKIIVTPGFKFEQAIFDAQTKYPDVKFVLIDGVPNNGDYAGNFQSRVAPNTLSIIYNEHEAAFLAGYAVVKDGFRNLGFIGGIPFPAVKKFGFGYVAGAFYAANEIGIASTFSFPDKYYEYVFDFAPKPEYKSLAAGWYSQGVEVIHVAAGGVGNSVMGAAEEANNKWVVGVDVDQASQSTKVITSALKQLGKAAYDALDNFYNNKWNGGQTIFYTAQNSGVGIPADLSRFRNQSSVKTGYDALMANLAAGRFTIPDSYTALRTYVSSLGVPVNDPNRFPTAVNADANP
jgi:basic membrane protein A and related proteins